MSACESEMEEGLGEEVVVMQRGAKPGQKRGQDDGAKVNCFYGRVTTRLPPRFVRVFASPYTHNYNGYRRFTAGI